MNNLAAYIENQNRRPVLLVLGVVGRGFIPRRKADSGEVRPAPKGQPFRFLLKSGDRNRCDWEHNPRANARRDRPSGLRSGSGGPALRTDAGPLRTPHGDAGRDLAEAPGHDIDAWGGISNCVRWVRPADSLRGGIGRAQGRPAFGASRRRLPSWMPARTPAGNASAAARRRPRACRR